VKRIQAALIAGLLLLILMLPQLVLAAGPAISSVIVIPSSITATSATIVWTTNTTSDSRVNYGTTKPKDGTWGHVDNTAQVTTHIVDLTGLTAATTYYFEVESTDGSGTATDNNSNAYYDFTTGPPQYDITLDDTCGVCGELIDPEEVFCNEIIKATMAVAEDGEYYVCWDSKAAWDDDKATGVVGTFEASGAGVYTLTFFMPEAKKGSHTVYLTDNTYTEKAKATFEVLPSVKTDLTEGPVGTTVTLNGYGFNANEPRSDFQFKFADTKITPSSDFVSTDAKGSWTISSAIPDIPAGGYTFDVLAKEGTVWVTWVNKDFEVTPQITANTDSGTVWQTIEVSGTGFASEEEDIEVTFDGEVMKPSTYPNVDENGSWNAVIAVPPLQSGTYPIDASGKLTRARDVPDFEFTVSPGVTVEPSSAYVGDTITVAGGGFEPEETGIRVTFAGQVIATGITADIDGIWESSFVLPASGFGSQTVSASGDITPSVQTTFAIETQITKVSPVEGAPGDSISLTGNGFHCSQDLTVTIGGVTALGDMRTQSNGNVNVTFRVPKGSPESEQTLLVTDEGGATDQVDFTVTKKILSTTPLPTSPKESKLRSGDVTFRWQGATGSNSYTYTLEINTSAGSGNIWSKAGISESSYTLTEEEALPKGNYYWRVKVVDDYGNEGAWSDSIEFTVSPIPTWVWVVVGLVVLVVLMVVAYRETKFKVTE